MKRFPAEINLFFNALVFFTRIPAPKGVVFSESNQNLASRYFPLIGLLIGSVCAFIYLVSSHIFPSSIALLLSMATSLLLTGAFHEDGLADSADGFGGGWTKKQILQIMKDSRIGTYGTVTVITALALKYNALAAIAQPALIMVLGHSLSRLAAVFLIYKDQYVRDDDQAKAKPLANSIDLRSLGIAALPPIAVLLMMDLTAWLVLAPVALTVVLCSRYFNQRIGGYTGDCLGACQQLSELTIYLFFCIPLFLD